MSANRSRGFTVVEAIVLIMILGIVAAFAVPKFAALDSQARTASVNGLAGSVRSAAALARGLAMASGETTRVTMEGATVSLLNSYPDATTTGIPHAVNTNGEFTFTAGSSSTTAATWIRSGAPAPANCSVSYTAAGSNGAPTVAVTTNGC